jgi:hypothetical protein
MLAAFVELDEVDCGETQALVHIDVMVDGATCW